MNPLIASEFVPLAHPHPIPYRTWRWLFALAHVFGTRGLLSRWQQAVGVYVQVWQQTPQRRQALALALRQAKERQRHQQAQIQEVWQGRLL